MAKLEEGLSKVTPDCMRCRQPGFVQYEGDQWLCKDCYPLYGSCCLEFGGDDVWVEKEEREKAKSRA